uniref:BZIP domain-containing protein n=1 Tax=Hyaloperonospora arabidopsidis (strain Emoy2) TaxID=559515 RepID=M4BSG2_HYAAE
MSRDVAGFPAVNNTTPRRCWPLSTETSPPGYDYPFNDESVGPYDSRPSSSSLLMDYRKGGGTSHGYRATDQVNFQAVQDSPAGDYDRASRAFQMDYDLEPQHSQTELQRYLESRQSRRAMDGVPRRTAGHQELYAREMRGREEPPDDVQLFDHPTRLASLPRSLPSASLLPFGPLSSDTTREVQSRRYNVMSPPTAHSFRFGGLRSDEMPLEPATVDLYPFEGSGAGAPVPRRHEFTQEPDISRQRAHHPILRGPHYGEYPDNNETVLADRRPALGPELSRVRLDTESRPMYKDMAVASSSSTGISQHDDYRNLLPSGGARSTAALSSEPLRQHSRVIARPQTGKRPRPHDPFMYARAEDLTMARQRPRATMASTIIPAAVSDIASFYRKDEETQPKRRCGRKSMNYSSEQKRERNRAAVKKCRQRQALKLEYLRHKAESLTAENHNLSEMLLKDAELDEGQRASLMRGIQMDILLKIKEIFTQSLPKDFVLDADSIWDLNSVLTVSMPSRCYYGVESIKDFWRTSLRMRNKGKIRSFWAWLFRLPPGDRFLKFEIQPFSPTSNLYFISWTTKSSPSLAGSMIIMFGDGHRVTLHVECFGWLIWRYLLTNKPFPDISLD